LIIASVGLIINLNMPEWPAAIECPKCGSKETRFVEPHYEMSVYECNVCGCRFEIEEDE